MRRGLIVFALLLAGCGSSTPAASDVSPTPTPTAPNGMSGTTGPTGASNDAPTVVPATPSATPTPPQPGASAEPQTGGAPAVTSAPTKTEQCLAERGITPDSQPTQEEMTAALNACAPSTGGAAAPSEPDPLKACLERNRPAHPSDAAVRRVILKCSREVSERG